MARPSVRNATMGPPPERGKAPVYVLPREKRIAVLATLLEGNSERAVERLTGVNRETVGKLGLSFGEGAQRLHDRIARALPCVDIECDEAWSFCGVKERRTREDHRAGSGDAYSFVAHDSDTRFNITWHVGKRDAADTRIFVRDLRSRLVYMPNLVSDGFVPYIAAVGAEFGLSVNFAQMVKNYSAKPRRDDEHRYEPPRGIDFITKRTIYGSPDLDDASTAYIERNNATMRHKIGRMRRLCYAFSKKVENHRAAVALGHVAYNLCWIVRTLRVTPAMAVGITSHVWDVADLHDAITAEVAPVEKPKAQALMHREPPGVAKQMSTGGWLRLLHGGKEAPTGPGLVHAPGPRPEPPPSARPPLREAPRTWEQLDLFGPRPDDKDENQPD